MIQRGIAPGNVKRLVIAGGRGGDQTDIVGARGNCRQQRHRLEIGHILRPAFHHIKVATADGERIGQEKRIELATLGRLRELQIMGEIRPGVDLCVRMEPGRNMIAGRMDQRAELQEARSLCLSH